VKHAEKKCYTYLVVTLRGRGYLNPQNEDYAQQKGVTIVKIIDRAVVEDKVGLVENNDGQEQYECFG
jgi:hypothetical protein